MKKGKWLIPSIIIVLFCIGLGILTNPIVNQINKTRVENKEKRRWNFMGF